jgi:hypothetical protein
MDLTHSTADLFGWISPPIAPAEPAHYPAAPGFKGPRDGPSHEAAKAVALSVTGRRREVLDFLRTRATEPMTADAIAAALSRSILSIRPRVCELHALGLIEADTTRGKNESGMTASRWKAIPETRTQAQTS